MNLKIGFNQVRNAVAHWGLTEYILLLAFWAALSIPLYIAGWKLVSLFSLPIFLALTGICAYFASVIFKPIAKPRIVVTPQSGFSGELNHPALGKFVLSSYSNERYERIIDWCGNLTSLSLSIAPTESLSDLFAASTRMFEDSTAVNKQVQKFLVNELLPTIRNESLQSRSDVLSQEEFLSLITLEMITIHADQSYEFLYNDSDLLGGHWIEVHGSLDQGPIEMDTPG